VSSAEATSIHPSECHKSQLHSPDSNLYIYNLNEVLFASFKRNYQHGKVLRVINLSLESESFLKISYVSKIVHKYLVLSV